MSPFVQTAFAVLTLCSALCLYRIARGPTAPDRTVAIDILGTLMVAFCCLMALWTGQEYYMNIAIAWALISFVGTLAMAKYLEGGPTMLESLAYWLMGVGIAFDLLGCVGLVRLPDVYNRAQAATKCVTLGTCMVLFGVAMLAFASGDMPVAMGVKALLCAAFVLLTSPVAAHAPCRGAYLSGVPLWPGSVEDAFAPRAHELRNHTATQGTDQGEKTQTP